LIGASIAGLSFGNVADPSQLGQVFIKLARCAIALVSLTRSAMSVAMIAKNQMAGIGAVIVYFIGSILSDALLS